MQLAAAIVAMRLIALLVLGGIACSVPELQYRKSSPKIMASPEEPDSAEERGDGGVDDDELSPTEVGGRENGDPAEDAGVDLPADPRSDAGSAVDLCKCIGPGVPFAQCPGEAPPGC